MAVDPPELFRRWRARPQDRDAAAAFLGWTAGFSFRLARALGASREVAEDVAQDVTFVLARRPRAVRDADAVVGFVRTATTRTALRQLARRRREVFTADPHSAAQAHGADEAGEDYDDSSETRELRGLVKDLAPRERAAIVLRYWLDLPEAEVAEALGCRPGTAASLLSRARGHLRNGLRDPIPPANVGSEVA